MENQNSIPKSLLIGEARAKVETILNTEGLTPAVKELIFKEAWLRAAMMAEQEMQRDYAEYTEKHREEEQEVE